MSAFQEYLRVLRLHMRMQFSAVTSNLGMNRQRRSGRETAKIVGLGLLMLYAVGAILLFYGLILFPFLRGAAGSGMQALVMGIIVLACMLVILIFGTLTLISLVFGAKDAEFYAALPLREQSVFAAKFTMVYAIETGMSAFFLWPAVVIYGVVSNFTPLEFILLILRAIPVWLLLPAVPLAFAALLSMLFVRLTALSKHRDTVFMVIGMAFVLICAVGPSLFSSRIATAIGDENAIMEILSDNSAMLNSATQAFPPARWIAHLLVGDDAAEIGFSALGLLAAVAAGLTVCLLLSRRLYYKGVLAQLEAPKGKTKGYNRHGVKSGSALKAYFSKEMRIILRSPVYAMNIITGVIIFPLMIAVVAFGGNTNLSVGASELSGIIDSLRGMAGGDMFFLIAAGIVMLMSVMSMSVSTSFSREGNMLWISQTVPVPVRTQVAARILGGYAFSGTGAVLSLAVMAVFLGFSVTEVLFGLIAGLCATFPVLAAALIPDALRPKRKWNSEAEAVKQNFNSILAMLIDIGIAVAIGVAAYILQKIIPVWAVGIVLSLVCLAVGYALFLYVTRVSENMMQTIDG